MLAAIPRPATEVSVVTQDLRFWNNCTIEEKDSGSQLAGFATLNKNYLT